MNDRVFNALRKIATDVENVPAAQRLANAITGYRPGVAQPLPGYAEPRPGSVGDRLKRLAPSLIMSNPMTAPAYLGHMVGSRLRKILPKYNPNAPKMMEAAPGVIK